MAERHRFERGHAQDIFARMVVGLAAEHGAEDIVMIPSQNITAQIPFQAMDATYLKAHRTAASLGVKKGAWTPDH